ncbi:MAG: zinc-dependent alcohol dehydrogenase family protein [Arthrobacter sp.]|jgi:threonine dehydrogenase-like Zn-dependent dehydrogenase|nr:zinc-dependent alcohol dehydrogenase family protein [Arthrobacter sp.]
MRATMINGTRDVSVEELPRPELEAPTDAIIKVVAACVCGSDLWPYRGVVPVKEPRQMGHEYVGIIEELGSEVTGLEVGQFVVGSFITSDNTCEICRAGYQSKCVHAGGVGTAQAQYARITNAAGTLVATPEYPAEDLIPSLLAASDVLGTGWFGAVEAHAGPGKTIAVVGDGAVGLLAILSAKQLGAERIIAFSRHPERQALAREFGATDIIEERGDEGVAKLKELTGGLGAHGVVEAVGTQESIEQALRSARGGGYLTILGVAHGVQISGRELFSRQVHVVAGGAPVRRFLPELIDLILERKINPGRVFTLDLPLEEAPAAYRAMDERTAIKVLLRP